MFLEIYQSFGLLPKGLVSKKSFCIGHPSKEFTEEWRSSVKYMDKKCRDLLLHEHCKTLFLLMESFWDEIKDFNFDLKWLFKVRNHFEKLERKLEETKRKKLSNLSKNAEIKKLVLARFRNIYLILNLKSILHPFVSLDVRILTIFTLFSLLMNQIILKMNLMCSFKVLKIT